MPWLVEHDIALPDMSAVKALPVAAQSPVLVQRDTQPPDALSESELITLMEKHGIGTDASIAVHISNIVDRNYASVRDRGGRAIEPTRLGVVLVHGYRRIDADIVRPAMRAHIERLITLIAQGKARYDVVVPHALACFKRKFDFFVRHIDAMDELFDATFTARVSALTSISSNESKRMCVRYCACCHAWHRIGTISVDAEVKMWPM
jgi:DNA topoisomerase-3